MGRHMCAESGSTSWRLSYQHKLRASPESSPSASSLWKRAHTTEHTQPKRRQLLTCLSMAVISPTTQHPSVATALRTAAMTFCG